MEVTMQDVRDYLDPEDRRGWDKFLSDWMRGQTTLRLGQMFYNFLDHSDRDKLAGTEYDPFHKNDWPSVLAAVKYLLEN